MTKQMLSLAGGKVALVLEGGYVIRPMCDSAEMCLRALLGDEVNIEFSVHYNVKSLSKRVRCTK